MFIIKLNEVERVNARHFSIFVVIGFLCTLVVCNNFSLLNMKGKYDAGRILILVIDKINE